MILFPWVTCAIDSSLSPERCQQVLASVTQEQPFILFAISRRTEESILFRGRVGQDTFLVSRVIYYRNSFKPVIKGYFHPGGSGTQVAVTMRLNLFVAVFITLWLGVVGSVAVGVWVRWIATGRLDVSVPIVTLMFLAGYLMTVIGFGVEATKAKALLTQLLQEEKMLK